MPTDTLTRRASLGVMSNLLQQVARFMTGFVISPVIIRGLGSEMYGAWTMIQQTIGYLSLSDLEASGTLKFSLATAQHIEDGSRHRRQVGAALIVWSRMLPLVLLLGLGAVWGAPWFIRTDPTHVPQVRWAMGIALFALVLDQLLSIPSTILRGMNLDYKAMGTTAFVLLAAGLSSILAIRLGWGLPGIALSAVISSVLTCAVRFPIARREVPWFGVERPSRDELSRFARTTGWLFAGSLGALLLNASDLLLVGVVLGPKAAAVYATTGAVLRMVIDPVFSIFGATTMGVAGICGRREWARLERVRVELHSTAVTAMVVIGVGVVTLNEAFLRLWIGPGFYGGMATNVLLVLIAFQSIPLRADTGIIDGLMQFREKAVITAASGTLVLLVGAVGARTLGLPGMALGTMLGRSVSIVAFPVLIRRGSGIGIKGYVRAMMRPVAVGLTLIGLSIFVPLRPTTHIGFAAVAVAVGGVTLIAMLFLGLDRSRRSALLNRFTSQLSGRLRPRER